MRNRYGALTSIPEWVRALVGEVQKAGVFQSGVVSDKKNRGVAVNWDAYGYDEAQTLAVIQVRQCVFNPKRYSRVRKDYYLVGLLESGAPFAHPIDSPARSKRAMTTPEACIRYVQTKLWGCEEEDLPHIIRQGDVALIPARLPRGAELVEEEEIVLAGSHRLRAKRMWRSGEEVFVAQTSLHHLPGEHSPVRHDSGIRRVVVAPRASTWGFSAPTLD